MNKFTKKAWRREERRGWCAWRPFPNMVVTMFNAFALVNAVALVNPKAGHSQECFYWWNRSRAIRQGSMAAASTVGGVHGDHSRTR
jgi:hypothetical protein